MPIKPLSDSELAKLEWLETVATPGPWSGLSHGTRVFIEVEPGVYAAAETNTRNQEIATAARNALLSLIAEVRQYREVKARVADICDQKSEGQLICSSYLKALVCRETNR